MQKFILGSLALACATMATAEQIKVPLSNPGQPATVKVHLITGSITVTAGDASQVIVDSAGGTRERPEAPAGMHRLDVTTAGLEAQEDHNVVSIESNPLSGSGGNLTIQVPPHSSLQLRTINGGHVDVTGIDGDIEAANVNGSVTLKNISGSAVASSQNGNIIILLDKVTPNKPMSFTTLNGKIDVTIPGDTKARLRLKSDHGSVFSDFDVKMEKDPGNPVVEDARGQGGKYRIRMDKNIYGSINGGGPEFRFETMNGNIVIHKK